MSELPFYITTSETRRRHNNNISITAEITAAAEGVSSTINTEAPSHSHSFNTLNNVVEHSSIAQQLNSSSSLRNFSSLIVPATNLWSAAQQFSIQFAEQLSNDLTSENEQSAINQIKQIDKILLPIEMPFRDRTGEFKTVAKSCQLRHQPNGYLAETKSEREKMLKSSIQFNQLAKRIGRDLSLTCTKMEKLSLLAKNKSLFDDRAGEIEELSQAIKQDITGLNKQIANLQQVIMHRSHSDGLSQKQEQISQNHSKLVVVGLQTKLASISKTFKNVLEIRTENLKLKRARREKFSQTTTIPSSLPQAASTGQLGSILLHDDMAASSGSSSYALDMDKLEQQRIYEQATLIDESQTYHQSRYSAMENIESSISELGTIFRQLATLVSEQGEMITRIDSNVEDTAINVEAAHHELLKYFNNISRNRWLIIKVFGVLLAFFIFFVIFMT